MSGTTHEDFDRMHDRRGGSDREFGFVVGVALLVIGLWPLYRGGSVRFSALTTGGVLVLLAYVRPAVLRPLNRLWTALGMTLGRVINPVVLGLIFYLVIAPLAALFRLAGRDPLRLKPTGREESYWIRREPPGPRPETMVRQF